MNILNKKNFFFSDLFSSLYFFPPPHLLFNFYQQKVFLSSSCFLKNKYILKNKYVLKNNFFFSALTFTPSSLQYPYSFSSKGVGGGFCFRHFSVFSSPNSNLPNTPKPPPPDQKQPKINQNVQFTWKQALFTTSVCGLILLAWFYERNRVNKAQRIRVEESDIGKPKLGCNWILINQKAKIISNFDLKGKYLLIYFGFTFCPDICPQELQKQMEVINQLDEKFGEIVQPVFITVDPSRDTVAQIDSYCREFHPRLIGFTGTPGQIKKVTRGYRVYYNEGIRTSEEDYLVDHSIIHYFIGPNGKFRDFYGKNLSVKDMVHKISDEIINDKKKKEKRLNQKDEDD